METDKLRAFVVIAQTENLRRAAELLRLTPSALSKTLRILEDELGLALTTPLGRGLTLTPEGRRLASNAERIIRELDALGDGLRNERVQRKNAPLRIATFEVFSTYFLQVLDQVKWKERGLVLHEVNPGELERAVEQESVDLGITYIPMAYPRLEHLKVATIEMGVFKRRGSFKSIEQQNLPFVVPVLPLQGAPSRVRGLDGWPDDAYERTVMFEVTLLESALELCRQGRCAGYFPRFIVEQHNRRHRPEFSLEQHPSPYRGRVCRSDVFIVKRKDKTEDENVRLVAKMIRMGCTT